MVTLGFARRGALGRRDALSRYSPAQHRQRVNVTATSNRLYLFQKLETFGLAGQGAFVRHSLHAASAACESQ
jgi:hypothetical protein